MMGMIIWHVGWTWALRCDHLAYRLDMGSWHVVYAWSVSDDGHRPDMGYVTWWVLRCDHLAFRMGHTAIWEIFMLKIFVFKIYVSKIFPSPG